VKNKQYLGCRGKIRLSIFKFQNLSQPSLFLGVLLAICISGILSGCTQTADSRVNKLSVDKPYTLLFTNPNQTSQSDHLDPLGKAVAQHISQAKSTLDIAAYELNNETITEAISLAKSRGVQIRIVTEHSNRQEAPLQKLEQQGIPVEDDGAENRGLMHDKFLIIDGQVLGMGSMNFTRNCTQRNNNNFVFWDSHQDPAIAQLIDNYQIEFEQLWSGKFGPMKVPQTPYPKIQLKDGTVLETYFSPEDQPLTALENALTKAKQSVDILAFSFTAKALEKILQEDIARGVAVRGIFEHKQNSTYSSFLRLSALGGDIREDTNLYMMHHKVLLIDRDSDAPSLVFGSFNFSIGANTRNDENLLIVHNNKAMSQSFGQEFDHLWSER
jgi:phosphatidylserine/phosphatidylglycerophosphate/cardiolipin synthase-like enzyme